VPCRQQIPPEVRYIRQSDFSLIIVPLYRVAAFPFGRAASAPPARPRRLACQVGAGHLRVARPSSAACRQLDCCRCLRSQQVTALPKIQARERTSLFHPDYQRRVLRYGTRVAHCWRQTRAASLEKLEQTPQSSLGFAVRRTLLACQPVCALQVSGLYLAACRAFPSRTHEAAPRRCPVWSGHRSLAAGGP